MGASVAGSKFLGSKGDLLRWREAIRAKTKELNISVWGLEVFLKGQMG